MKYETHRMPAKRHGDNRNVDRYPIIARKIVSLTVNNFTVSENDSLRKMLRERDQFMVLSEQLRARAGRKESKEHSAIASVKLSEN